MISQNLTRIRESQKLSKSELGRRSGVNKRTIEWIEHEKQKPKLDTIEKLSKALNVSIEELVK